MDYLLAKSQLSWVTLFGVAALLFVQILAFLKVRRILQRVLSLFHKVSALLNEAHPPSPSVRLPQAPPQVPSSPLIKTCRYCRYRLTYLADRVETEFFYKCQLRDQPVGLDDSCHHFTFDPQRAEYGYE